MAHGAGEWKFDNGDTWTGNAFAGWPHGEGVLRRATGSLEHGVEFFAGQRVVTGSIDFEVGEDVTGMDF